jgi:phosphatidylserine synthase
MMRRRGEKIGWIGGWLGGFVWLLLLSVIWLFQNRMGDGIIGIVLFTIAIITILVITPWRYPDTRYWKLMLPIYVLFFLAIVLSIYRYGGFENTGLQWTAFFWVIPCFVPVITIGRRTWNVTD